MMDCFAGGVILAISFLHILPKAVEMQLGVMTGVNDDHAGHRLLRIHKNSTIATPAKEKNLVDSQGISRCPTYYYSLAIASYC